MDFYSHPYFAPIVITAVICLIHYFKRYLVTLVTQPHPFQNQSICIVNSIPECQDATTNLIQSCAVSRVVGLDCEWVGKNKIALLQLATTDGFCVLIRLCKLDHVPTELKALLEDNTILKVGIATMDDARLLQQGYGVVVRSCLDLRYLSGDAGGLAALTLSVLGVELDKSRHVRCSDWEAEVLDDRQTEYAALDALSAVKIFHKLSHKKMTDMTFARLKYSCIDPTWNEILQACTPFLDRKYKAKPNKSPSANNSGKVSVNENGRRISEPRYSTLKKPHYDNCWLVAPDGTQLSTCCLSKTRWYVGNGLGEVISQDPVTVRLFFEPSGRSVDNKWRYVNVIKVNQCVVCGTKESLIRKNVVPYEYKRHFPISSKKHEMHDILLLCIYCHQLSNISDVNKRRQLDEVYCGDSSINIDATKKTRKEDVRLVRNAARPLLNHGDKLPVERRDMFLNVVREYCNVAEVTNDMLQSIMNLEEYEDNPEFVPHGVRIVDQFTAGPGILQLKRMWREHFVATMHPRFLPEFWSTTYDCPTGEVDEPKLELEYSASEQTIWRNETVES